MKRLQVWGKPFEMAYISSEAGGSINMECFLFMVNLMIIYLRTASKLFSSYFKVQIKLQKNSIFEVKFSSKGVKKSKKFFFTEIMEILKSSEIHFEALFGLFWYH